MTKTHSGYALFATLGLCLFSSPFALPGSASAAATHHQSRAHHSTAARHHTALQGPSTVSRVMGADSRPDTPKSLESQETAPPLPEGYKPVEDFDETMAAHSPAILTSTPTGTLMPSGDAQQMPRDPSSTAKQFDVLGVKVRVDAPVTPPYNASFTYDTYGGQPGKGREATAAWGAAGQP